MNILKKLFKIYYIIKLKIRKKSNLKPGLKQMKTFQLSTFNEYGRTISVFDGVVSVEGLQKNNKLLRNKPVLYGLFPVGRSPLDRYVNFDPDRNNPELCNPDLFPLDVSLQMHQRGFSLLLNNISGDYLAAIQHWPEEVFNAVYPYMSTYSLMYPRGHTHAELVEMLKEHFQTIYNSALLTFNQGVESGAIHPDHLYRFNFVINNAQQATLVDAYSRRRASEKILKYLNDPFNYNEYTRAMEHSVETINYVRVNNIFERNARGVLYDMALQPGITRIPEIVNNVPTGRTILVLDRETNLNHAIAAAHDLIHLNYPQKLRKCVSLFYNNHIWLGSNSDAILLISGGILIGTAVGVSFYYLLKYLFSSAEISQPREPRLRIEPNIDKIAADLKSNFRIPIRDFFVYWSVGFLFILRCLLVSLVIFIKNYNFNIKNIIVNIIIISVLILSRTLVSGVISFYFLILRGY